MTEKKLDFWTQLRFEITNSEIFEAYCDWIEPKVCYFYLTSTTIEGEIGILDQDLREFNFALTINKKLKNSREIEAIDIENWTIEYNRIGFNGNTLEIKLIEN